MSSYLANGLGEDRSHHHPTTSELFICFTCRISSMKLSKSNILSPGHARHEPPLTLPTSVSRRLKANGSIKGGQSPATFPACATTGRKRGSGFDNPEPSSPKVTCIGQVKMKTKKKVRQSRSLSNRRSDNISFRKIEHRALHEERGLLVQNNQKTSGVHFQSQDQCATAVAAHRNQRWVHLPLTIYEALREFSCLFPCRSSCFSTNEKEKEEKEKVNGSRQVDNTNNVVARWLVALQDAGEAEKMEEMQQITMRSSRRHVFEGIEFKDHDESVELKEGSVVEEEKGRVSICVPPKNALLLMRCRSDPMKMADITNRFWESPARKETDEEVEIGENEGVQEELVDAQNFECKVQEETSISVDLAENEENPEVVQVMEMETESNKDEAKFKNDELRTEKEQVDEKESEIKAHVAAEVNPVEQVPENIPDNQVPEQEKEEESSIDECIETEHEEIIAEEDATLEVVEEENDDATLEERFKSTIEKLIEETLLLEEAAKSDAPISDPAKSESGLPDCLLLMMCEPKLSMEVSKETWVCSKQAKSVKKKKKEIPIEPNNSKHLLLQPPRSSCSFPVTGVPPAAMSSMATMIEQKLVAAVAYEPLVLTRCKSEPMRATATAVKVAPETCFWKIEPHRRATFGFGAAGVGF